MKSNKSSQLNQMCSNIKKKSGDFQARLPPPGRLSRHLKTASAPGSLWWIIHQREIGIPLMKAAGYITAAEEHSVIYSSTSNPRSHVSAETRPAPAAPWAAVQFISEKKSVSVDLQILIKVILRINDLNWDAGVPLNLWTQHSNHLYTNLWWFVSR